MTDTNTIEKGGNLSARASRLNEIGEHYFVGWLVSAGFQRPEIMTEIDRVLHDIDNGAALPHWTTHEDSTAVAGAAHERSLPPAPENPVVVSADSSPPAAVVAPHNPLAVVPGPEPKPAKRLPLAVRLMAAIFHKPRMAA